jgi:hypothetical protein
MQRFAKDPVNAQPDLIVGHTTPGHRRACA